MLTSPGLVPLGKVIGVLGVLGEDPELFSVYVLSVVGVVGVVGVGIVGRPKQDVDGRKIEGLFDDEKDDGLKLLENLDVGLQSEEVNLL